MSKEVKPIHGYFGIELLLPAKTLLLATRRFLYKDMYLQEGDDYEFRLEWSRV